MRRSCGQNGSNKTGEIIKRADQYDVIFNETKRGDQPRGLTRDEYKLLVK